MANIQLHVNKFEDMILRRGRTVKWQEAIICSCWDMDAQSADYDCKACNGQGHTYSEPIEDVVLVMSVKHNKEFNDFSGVFEMGDAIMSVGYRVPLIHPVTKRIDKTTEGRINKIFNVGMYDIITLTDDVYKTSEILVKNTPIYERDADTLLNDDVVEVLAVRVSDPVTGDITDYEKDIDFELDGKRIVWLGVNEPEDGQRYAVQYNHRPAFTVLTQLPTPRHQDGQDLPKNVVLRYRAGGFDRKL